MRHRHAGATRLLSRLQRPKNPHRTFRRIGERMGHERVITRLKQPDLEDGTPAHRHVHRLYTDQGACDPSSNTRSKMPPTT